MRNRGMHKRWGDDESGGRRRGGRGGGGRGRGDHIGRRRGGPGGRRGERGRGGKRGRVRRGEARFILLDVLRDGPKHGYEIIKTLEERSGGEYVPSPGTVYPTLQLLADQGLVSANEKSERRTYELTKEGEAELDAQSELVAAFWSRFAAQDDASSQPEVGFLEEELEHLSRTVWSGLRTAIADGDQARVREVREAVEACRSAVREIVSTSK